MGLAGLLTVLLKLLKPTDSNQQTLAKQPLGCFAQWEINERLLATSTWPLICLNIFDETHVGQTISLTERAGKTWVTLHIRNRYLIVGNVFSLVDLHSQGVGTQGV